METPLDRAFRAHEAKPEDERLRLRFHERLLDAELYLLLREEAADGTLKPEVFALEVGPVALVFDRDERLAAFLDAPAPYAALPGRRILRLLAGQGIGLGLNLGVAPSSTLLPAVTVDWLAAMAAEAPFEAEGSLRGFAPPRAAPADIVEALGIKLAAMAKVIGSAHLVTARHYDGSEGMLLALTGVPAAAQGDVAAAVAEAVRFSGAEATVLDVTFPAAGGAVERAIAEIGWRFDLPRPAEAPVRARRVPGTDPDRPPILR
jgi:hypothetical protein